MQLDHHPKGDEIQDYLKDITGKSTDATTHPILLPFLCPCHAHDPLPMTPIVLNVMLYAALQEAALCLASSSVASSLVEVILPLS